ncbi:hypothetical protein JX265_001702 [Neoarthrinium moseri]|uniref:Uncharacterized protein n=1 Tax=Neoarthrinium moseri TaxID=1658444 RepID=A0A9Q0AVC5_9PEZI|nr:hypothetical protein JX265_001702 [Neoarthrinium moseri]
MKESQQTCGAALVVRGDQVQLVSPNTIPAHLCAFASQHRHITLSKASAILSSSRSVSHAPSASSSSSIQLHAQLTSQRDQSYVMASTSVFIDVLHRVREAAEVCDKGSFAPGVKSTFKDLMGLIAAKDYNHWTPLHKFRIDFCHRLCNYLNVGPFPLDEPDECDENTATPICLNAFARVESDHRQTAGSIIHAICANREIDPLTDDIAAQTDFDVLFHGIRHDLEWESRSLELQQAFIGALRDLLGKGGVKRTGPDKSMKWFRLRLFAKVYGRLWPEYKFPSYFPGEWSVSAMRTGHERVIDQRMLYNALKYEPDCDDFVSRL